MTTPILYDLNSAEGTREIVSALFLGYNYRLYTEGETRNQLLVAYESLMALLKRLPDDADYAEWMGALKSEVSSVDGIPLEWWLLGLGKKTADNLGIRRNDRLDYLEEVGQHIRTLCYSNDEMRFEDAMLMLWAGAATLTIRGSRKSTAGKRLERAFLRASLTILGLSEGEDFWLNMERDEEVAREMDVEIASRRGRIRVEMGLIASGNQEVIEDKIARVGAGGMVIYDNLGPRSNAHSTAANSQVRLIPIRNSRPLEAMHDYLCNLVQTELIRPPNSEQQIRDAVGELPDDIFINDITSD